LKLPVFNDNQDLRVKKEINAAYFQNYHPRPVPAIKYRGYLA